MKYTKAILISALSVLLAACGSNQPAEPQNAVPETDEGTAVVPGGEESFISEPVIIPEDSSEFTLEPFAAIDTDECTVTVKDIDTSVGFTINFELENKSPDTDYNFIVESVAVNGMNGYGYMHALVPAGQKMEQPMELGYIYKSWGMGKYTDVEVTMDVRTPMYNEEPAVHETFHIYPYGEDKAEKFVRESLDTDQVLIDDDTVKLIIANKEQFTQIPPEGAGMVVNMYVENKTDETVNVTVVKASVNDYMIESGVPGVILKGGYCGTFNMYIEGSQFKEYEIEKIEELEFELRLINPDTYETVYSEIVTITP